MKVTDNENLGKVTMPILKIVATRIDRQQIGTIKRLRSTKPDTNKKNDGNKVFNPNMVKFKFREGQHQEREKKLANANLNGMSDA